MPPNFEVVCGDALDELAAFPSGYFHSLVCDPPAGISFMGRAWDKDHGGRAGWVAAFAEVFRECRRVLKPGGHALVWALPRTSHWTACALEDAGFEVRDKVLHVFGTGFPKSLNVSKAIDKRRPDRAAVLRVAAFVAACRDAAGSSNAAIDAYFGTSGMGGHWTTQGTQPAVPTPEQWAALKALLAMPDDFDSEVARLNGRKGDVGEAWKARPVTGTIRPVEAANTWSITSRDGLERAGAEEGSRAADWEGWGTALKPAQEEWILARVPLFVEGVGSAMTRVVDNVQAHGTGALHVDACRVPAAGGSPAASRRKGSTAHLRRRTAEEAHELGKIAERSHPDVYAEARPGEAKGRWPTNLVLTHFAECRPVGTRKVRTETAVQRHGGGQAIFGGIAPGGKGAGERPDATYAGADGMEEVEAWECVPWCPVAELDRQGKASGVHGAGKARKAKREGNPTGMFGMQGNNARHGDDGGAARFFPRFRYAAKPSGKERNEGLGALPKREKAQLAGAAAGKPREELDDVSARYLSKPMANHHPTVKPVALMRWLLRLVTPRGGRVLDCFAGSGTTGVAALREGFDVVLVEREPEFAEVARHRLAHAAAELGGVEDLL